METWQVEGYRVQASTSTKKSSRPWASRRKLTCKICKKEYATEQSRDRHIEDIHNPSGRRRWLKKKHCDEKIKSCCEKSCE